MSRRKSYNLTVHVRNVFADLAASKIIGGEVVANVLRASSNSELMEAIKSMYGLDEQRQMRLWFYIVTSVWKSDDKQTWFSDTECFFMRELIQNRGVLKKTSCMSIKALFTEHKTTTTAQNLHDMGLIHIFMINREVFYVLNGEFYDEVFGNGSER